MKKLGLTELHIQSAQNFRQMLDTNNVYLYLGKDSVWPDEDDPMDAENTTDCRVSARNNMIYLKKISSTNTALVIPKINWQINNVYTQYAPDVDLFGKNYYVLNSSGNVYKCLSNNNGAMSTQSPSGNSVNDFIGSDGYRWKYMYSIDAPLTTFVNTDYMVVPTDGQKSANQILVENNATMTSGSPEGGHGKNAYLELGARNIIVNMPLDFTGVTSFEHRQYGLIVNPELPNGTLMTNSTYDLRTTTINRMSGKVLTVSNHIMVDTAENNEEIMNFIIGF